jgi:hypothetical protein
MVLLTSFFTLRAVQKTRRDAAEALKWQNEQILLESPHNWLKMRTLHVKGIPEKDRAGRGLQVVLEKFLKDRLGAGRVLAIQIVPPFYEIFQIELKIRNLKDLNMMMIHQDSSYNCLIPAKYKQMHRYQQVLEEYEEEQSLASLNPFVPCGHAFVVVDSMSAC